MAAAGRPLATYSPAMRRRLDLAASIVVRPALVLLDEPTTDLDPPCRAEVSAVLRMSRHRTRCLISPYLAVFRTAFDAVRVERIDTELVLRFSYARH